jgi:hypothetical protein
MEIAIRVAQKLWISFTNTKKAFMVILSLAKQLSMELRTLVCFAKTGFLKFSYQGLVSSLFRVLVFANKVKQSRVGSFDLGFASQSSQRRAF